LKPYWGKPNVRNFREGVGNRVMANQIEVDVLEGASSHWKPKATAPMLYSTTVL